MELLGKIKVIGEVKTYGEKGFRKRELVLTTEEQYPQHILIEFDEWYRYNIQFYIMKARIYNQRQRVCMVKLMS